MIDYEMIAKKLMDRFEAHNCSTALLIWLRDCCGITVEDAYAMEFSPADIREAFYLDD